MEKIIKESHKKYEATNVILLLVAFLFTTVLSSDELPKLDMGNENIETTPWKVERINFYFENDLFFNTDNEYTAGLKLSSVYSVSKAESLFEKIPFIHEKSNAHFVSMGITQQIFTPTDTKASELVIDDRPYAGWLYFEYGVHESSVDELDSLVIQLGVIGECSGAEYIQKSVHGTRGIYSPNGWDNQLNNELGLNLIYQHKWRLVPDKVYGIDSNFIPFVEGSLGNVRTEFRTGMLMRFGWNPIEDFGSSSIDISGENGIPVRTNYLCSVSQPWSFTFNMTLAGKAVARNIFLDGNSFSESHYVKKENLVGYTSVGVSIRYRHYALDYIVTDFTKQFTAEKSDHKYGSLLFSYIY